MLERRGGAEISYDATAREAGLTKAGVLYHFPTREALVTAVVEHVALRWDAAMRADAGAGPDDLSPVDRTAAYVRLTLDGEPTRADVAIFSEALYRPQHAGPWQRVLAPWFDVSGCPPVQAARLRAARYAADGLWLARATGLHAPGSPAADAGVVAEVHALLPSRGPEEPR